MKKLAKAIAKNFFSLLKIEVSKLPQKRSNWTIDIGKFPIRMNPKGNLYDLYHMNPCYSRELSTLAKAVFSKYNFLTIADIGANVGDTVAVIKNELADVPVICIEGDRESFQLLRINTAQFSDVTTFQYYLGDVSSKLEVTIEKAGWNNTLTVDTLSDITIEIVTFDDFLIREAIDQSLIKLIKIDTEGFDNKIIRGADILISVIKPVIYFEYNTENHILNNENGLEIFSYLSQKGYSRIAFFDSNGKFILATRLNEFTLIEDLHNYTLRYRGFYYDICVFHESDGDIAETFIEYEKQQNKVSEQ